MIEPNEWIGDPTTGYQPDDPPQGEHWCSECCAWDDECTCDENTIPQQQRASDPVPMVAHTIGKSGVSPSRTGTQKEIQRITQTTQNGKA